MNENNMQHDVDGIGKDIPGDSPRISPEVWSRVRKSHHGIEIALRVKLLDIACRMSQPDKGPRSKAGSLSFYADLCEAMRAGANLPARNGCGADPDLNRFFDSKCLFGLHLSDIDLVVSKADLYAAYERFAREEGDSLYCREIFFKAIRKYAPVRDYRPRNKDAIRLLCLRGVSLREES